MEIEQITENLYWINNVVDNETLKRVQTELYTHEKENPERWRKENAQDHLKRKMIEDHPLCNVVEDQVREQLPLINSTINSQWYHAEGTRFWIDEPGFTIGIHRDDNVKIALHLYWDGENGTTFWTPKFDPKEKRSRVTDDYGLTYQFKFIPNSGYLMLNPNNETNMLFHSMLLPTTCQRLASYTYFRKD